MSNPDFSPEPAEPDSFDQFIVEFENHLGELEKQGELNRLRNALQAEHAGRALPDFVACGDTQTKVSNEEIWLVAEKFCSFVDSLFGDYAGDEEPIGNSFVTEELPLKLPISRGDDWEITLARRKSPKSLVASTWGGKFVSLQKVSDSGMQPSDVISYNLLADGTVGRKVYPLGEGHKVRSRLVGMQELDGMIAFATQPGVRPR